LFTIEKFDVDWDVATYYYDTETEDSSNIIDTVLKGKQAVEQDVTYDV